MRQYPIFTPLIPSVIPMLHDALWGDVPLHQTELRLRYTLQMMVYTRAWGVMVLVDERYIGYGQLTRWGSVGEISDLILLPQHRNRGIGTALIRHLAQLAYQHGMTTAEIGVDENNPSARRLYERLGFVPHRLVQTQTHAIHYLRCAMTVLLNP